MQVVVTTRAIRCAKLQSNQHTNTQFFTGQMPFLSPNQQCQSTEGKRELNGLHDSFISYQQSLSLSVLTAIFQVDLG